ncbi:MAG: beta-ketoacyl synthase [Rickettsiales bacterium]|nr:beta-ketoacyl synthase [Rickettsiales bacterium]
MGFDPIAIVGRSCLLPGAHGPEQLWEAVASGRDLISSAPEGRWRAPAEDVLAAPSADCANRSWSDRGGYVTGFEELWNPQGFAVPPAHFEGLDPLFLWALHCARAALKDAGDQRQGSVDRSRVSACFGNLGFPSAGMSRYAEALWTGRPDSADPRNRFMASGAAQLLRQALGLGPKVMCLDTACASSLYAIKIACNQLQDGEVDLALAGAVNCADDLFIHVGFTALSALSRSGQSRPFHAEADGLVPAEGAAFLALKRLADARADGDHIHGVIRGIGLSNDGRGRGFLAPAEEGQQRALEQAYEVAGIEPAEVSLLECHATGTSVGDATEIRSTSAVFDNCESLPIGSLKSNMGHLITAAGAAGLIKVLEAMRHQVRPPSLHAEQPNQVLAESPLRILEKAEPWPSEGPRIAGISAFGFGGNNAHLLVSEEHESIKPSIKPSRPNRQALAIVATGAIVGTASNSDQFIDLLLSTDQPNRFQSSSVELPIKGLRFPPRDLEEALPQQLCLLAAACEASGNSLELEGPRSGVFVGMEPDPEVCRYGLRWRLAELLRQSKLKVDDNLEWLKQQGEQIIPTLSSAGVVGTMPNIPANRINSQLDLGGASYSVSAGEDSGLRALELAIRALRSQELDSAMVAAVDLSCNEVHRAARAAAEDHREPGDAAVALVLRRLEDAEAAGENIIALLEEEPEGQLQDIDLSATLGASWAAGKLRDLIAASLCVQRRCDLDGSPIAIESQELAIRLGQGFSYRLRAASSPRATSLSPRIFRFAAATKDELLEALSKNQESLTGQWRCAILASTPEQLEERREKARRHIENGSPAGPGITHHQQAIEGELAFVFGGAGSAYPEMGRALLQAMPELADQLKKTSKLAYQRLLEPPPEEPDPLHLLWSSSALCQLHAQLSQDLLKLHPNAVIGYSSGESNSLFASGLWTDMDKMIEDAARSELFTRLVGGPMEVVETALGRPLTWETWTVLAPVDQVRELTTGRDDLFLSVIHSDRDCIVSGSAAACAELISSIGAGRCLRLHYDLAVHVPLLNQVADAWLDLHRRPITAQPGIRVYSGGPGGSYLPTSESCAQAILDQSNRCLDFRQVIEAAWRDGVRIFVEHGPQGSCSRWIGDILADREALIVSLDRKGNGVEALLEAGAALWSAGLDLDLDSLIARLCPNSIELQNVLSYPAHRQPIGRLTLPTARSSQSEPTMQTMPPAPNLPPVTESQLITTTAALPGPQPSHNKAATSSSNQKFPQHLAATPASQPAQPLTAPSSSTPSTATTNSLNQVPTTSDPCLDALRQQLVLMGQSEQQHLAQQKALHQRFLATQERSMKLLLQAAGAQLNGPSQVAPQQPNPNAANSILLESLSAAPEQQLPAPSSLPPKQPEPDLPAQTSPQRHNRLEDRLISSTAEQQAADNAGPTPQGPCFDFEQLKIHASGRISEIYGAMFKVQDDYVRQVRMPEPPLLLADRITGLDAVAGSMGKGTIWSESEVEADRWFMHQGHMPAGIMIESGQADLMLISYLGVDFTNQGERVYRLLGCELTYHGGLPKDGETLKYDIHMDGHATQGDVRLMFFHSDCRSDGKLRLSVRKGQAGFFTDQELAESDGCLWTPEEQKLAANPRLDPPEQLTTQTEFSSQQVRAFADGRPWQCFGEGFELCKPHTRTPRIQNGPMLLLGDVSGLNPQGGPWGRGYAKSTLQIEPELWFFDGHFKNDPCMPGTLMFEGCLQLMGFYMAALGYTISRDGWRFEPVPEESFALSCRGQVTPQSKSLTYELFVEEVHDGPIPKLYADLLCTVDGLKSFHARRVALQLIPGWPLDEGTELLDGYLETRAVAKADDFPFDYRSLLACANGRPSAAFGPIYQRFDSPGRVARLPNPPYHFLSRVTRTKGLIGSMEQGMEVDVEFDIDANAWYFEENGCRAMPFAVLLEAALQPCGWLASYMGCALTTESELCFRNLDGTGRLLVDILPDSGTLLTRVRSTSTSRTASMIIVSFEVECSINGKPVYEMDTVFGFFPQEALDNQVGLPTTEVQRELLESPTPKVIDLSARPPGYWSAHRPRLAEPMLLMLDRVMLVDPTGGEAGLGTARGEKDVDPGEWFFKAHFFQDPVQPGSLGIEAMIQLLQWMMLEKGLDEGISEPRFETLGLDQPMTWKYRGQVIPTNKLISSTLELTEVVREVGSVKAVARASLWVDGKRIYEASGLGMRIVSGGTPEPPLRKLDPQRDTWLNDHCPTWTKPALPLMSMVDLLAQGACQADPITEMRDVRITGWLDLPEARYLRTRRDGETVRLLSVNPAGTELEVASARVITGEYKDRPEPLEPLTGSAIELPYERGELFHGPAFQVMLELIRTRQGSSSRLRAQSGVPLGRLNPALLDGATHAIPHDHLELWDDKMNPNKVAYPALITELHLFGSTPKHGALRCEVRPDGFLGSRDFPAFKVQIIGAQGVWCQFRLIESCFEKGSLGSAPAEQRLNFLKDRQYVAGLRLSKVENEASVLTDTEVAAVDWMPGTLEELYGSKDSLSIARKEHIAEAHQLHPSLIPDSLPLQRFELEQGRSGELATVSGDGFGKLNVEPIRSFWSRWFARDPWPVEDLYYGLIQRFVRRVVITDPQAYGVLRGKSLLYLGNHQVGVESLLFSIIASALGEVPTVTLAKDEHRTTWLGQLIKHCFQYPGVQDPGVISFFDRQDKASLPRILGELAAEMTGPGRSVMVHVEGTRSLDCRKPVEKMSGAFIDMALATDAPIVPVRFVGALPTKPLQKRLEFPLNMGRQDLWIGRPLLPEELEPLHYGARKELVINAINELGPSNTVEQPLPGDPEFAARVELWRKKHQVSEEHAVLREVLAEVAEPTAEVRALLEASSAEQLNSAPSGAWLAELGKRLIGS